jgi:hypothetical protein
MRIDMFLCSPVIIPLVLQFAKTCGGTLCRYVDVLLLNLFYVCKEIVFYPILYSSYVCLGKSNSYGIVSFIKKYLPIVSSGSEQNMENYELEH